MSLIPTPWLTLSTHLDELRRENGNQKPKPSEGVKQGKRRGRNLITKKVSGFSSIGILKALRR
jgi:hypothetical protein